MGGWMFGYFYFLVFSFFLVDFYCIEGLVFEGGISRKMKIKNVQCFV